MRQVSSKGFVCVFTIEDKELLEASGYLLLKSKDGFHTFANELGGSFDFSNINHIFTNRMTF